MSPKTFSCPSLRDPLVNALDGLELFEDVADRDLQRLLLDFVEDEIVRGGKGLLIGKTYQPPEAKKWAGRSKSRLMLQYGVYTLCNRVYRHIPVETIAMEPIQALIDTLYAKGVLNGQDSRPNQCTINVYDQGNWLPGHIDNSEFHRPIITLSLLSEQEMVLGEDLRLVADGAFDQEQCRIRLPTGSVVCLWRNAANCVRHALPACTSRRISFTLRHLPEAATD